MHSNRALPIVISLTLLFFAAGLRAQPTGQLGAANRSREATAEAAPTPALKRHGLIAKELLRWSAPGAGQGVAVDEKYFYGIGNTQVRKYDKKTGERVAEWIDRAGGTIVHFNSGYVENGVLVVSHSNFPHLPMASSIEYFDVSTLTPVKSHSLGIQHGSLTWATRNDGFWWACFANYNDRGTTPGLDNRWTYFGKFDDRWQILEAWIFPPELVAAFGRSSCSGGSWGTDGALYVTGHDAMELYVLRLPKMGSVLELVTTIEVPFAGQAWAWDRSEPRTIYGITRKDSEVVVAQIPELPAELLRP
ncbi:MAG: hypothetical protein ABIZ04_16130 [Opitutus sp.]